MAQQDEKTSVELMALHKHECAKCNIGGSSREHGPNCKLNAAPKLPFYHLEYRTAGTRPWKQSLRGQVWSHLDGALGEARKLALCTYNHYRVVDQEGTVYEATSPFVVEGNTSFNDKEPAGPIATKVRSKRIYLIGSLRNPKVQEVAAKLRADGYEVFDDWQSAGPEADDYWQKYAQARGWTMAQALAAASAQNVFEFDRRNIAASDIGVLVMPAGKSGHLELGVMIGSGKPGFILLDGEPERFDVMYNYSPYSGGIVATSVEQLLKALDGV